jgi:uncharacterized protein (DUF2235 family)
MKRIVIACDGTWKRIDAEHPTNVALLARAVLPTGPDGVAQVVCRLDGLGTGRGTGALARTLDRALGGAFGLGLTATVAAAYRFLVANHAPGDAILLFGFSRGAYMARSLAGLIRTAGILPRERAAAVPAALALYRDRTPEARPEGAAARAFRAGHGAVEAAVGYLGVWDTVGALGLPGYLRLAQVINQGLAFHDTSLSDRVLAARHAVAVDERRRRFPPTLWDNLSALNAGAAGRDRPYRQQWFPGDHGAVGGGGPVTALSHDALVWVAEGAMAEGLALDPGSVGAWRAGVDALGPLSAGGARPPGLADRLLALGQRDRDGPETVAEVAMAARRRWLVDPSYRPGALARVAAALGGPQVSSGKSRKTSAVSAPLSPMAMPANVPASSLT